MNISLKKIAIHYGLQNQCYQLAEESAEFIQAVSKYRRGAEKSLEHIKEELADVLVVAEQLKYLLGEEDINRIMENKTNRQMLRIKDEKKHQKIEVIKLKLRFANEDNAE